MNNNTLKTNCLLVIVMLLWSSSLVLSKFLFSFYHPIILISIRMLISLACFVFFFKEIRSVKYQKNDWKLILLVSICEPCLFFILESQALVYSTANQIGMVTSIGPIITIIIAMFLLGEKNLTRQNYFGIIISTIGVIALLQNSKQAGDNAINPVLGNFLELGALICGAVYSVGFKILSKRYSVITLTFFQMLIGSVFFCLLAFMLGKTSISLNLQGLLGVLYLGVFVSFGSYIIFNLMISQNKVSNVVPYLNLVPLFTVLMSYYALQETININQCYACLVIMVGIFFSQRKKKEEKETVEV